jgi:carboxyl-terminal processing protease
MNWNAKLICLIVGVMALTFASTRAAFSEGKAPTPFMGELQLFAKSLSAITEGYVEPREARDLFYEAITGMLASLDKYSSFVDRRGYELMQIDITGEYGGIGAELLTEDGLPAIKTIYPDGSADKAGLRPHDKILKVDHEDVTHLALPDIAAKIRGELGTEVSLTIRRDVTQETFDITLTRETIEVAAVRDTRIAGRAVGYMRVVNFQENTLEQFDRALDSFVKKKIEALIIDLRNNGGGILPAGIGMAERFIPKGKKIVSVESRVSVQQQEHFSEPTKPLVPIEVVVLVNEGSASASEVFSAAMQHHGKATVVGSKTYGKASVQSVIPLDEVTGMKLTTARYVTPSGAIIDKVGITPDVIVDIDFDQKPVRDVQLEKALELLKQYM